jgi:hypothetical protein
VHLWRQGGPDKALSFDEIIRIPVGGANVSRDCVRQAFSTNETENFEFLTWFSRPLSYNSRVFATRLRRASNKSPERAAKPCGRSRGKEISACSAPFLEKFGLSSLRNRLENYWLTSNLKLRLLAMGASVARMQHLSGKSVNSVYIPLPLCEVL